MLAQSLLRVPQACGAVSLRARLDLSDLRNFVKSLADLKKKKVCLFYLYAQREGRKARNSEN